MIRRIKIKNFRSLDVDVTLDPVTVLVGRSGTGKSNFVDAVRFLRDRLRGSKANNSNILPITTKKDTILEYDITFNVPQMEGEFKYFIKLALNSAAEMGGPYALPIREERLYFNNEILFHREKSKWIRLPAVSSHNSLPENEICLSTLKGIQPVSIAHIALSEGIGCYDFPGSVCRSAGKTPPAEKDTSKGLTDHGQNVRSIFGEIRNDLTRLDAWNRINELMQFLNDSIETIDQQSGRDGNILVTHRFGDSSIVLDLARESEGCRRFFAYLLAFYQSPPKQTMFFEEPEKGLYPAAFAALAEQMKLCPETGQGQIVLTTHSPELLNCFDPDSLRVVVMENGFTKIGPVAPDQLEALRDHLISPGELLTVDDARIGDGLLVPSEV